MLYEDTDSCLLRLIECFMEAAPQLVLQLYIMCKLGAQDGLLVREYRIHPCISRTQAQDAPQLLPGFFDVKSH